MKWCNDQDWRFYTNSWSVGGRSTMEYPPSIDTPIWSAVPLPDIHSREFAAKSSSTGKETSPHQSLFFLRSQLFMVAFWEVSQLQYRDHVPRHWRHKWFIWYHMIMFLEGSTPVPLVLFLDALRGVLPSVPCVEPGDKGRPSRGARVAVHSCKPKDGTIWNLHDQRRPTIPCHTNLQA